MKTILRYSNYSQWTHIIKSVILISQNLFSKGKNARTISLNCNYLICFNNKRDQTQIRILGQQMFPDKIHYFRESFDDATSVPHGYLLIDLRLIICFLVYNRMNIF